MPPGMTHGTIRSVQTSAERGGAEYANVDLLDALARRGHDVVLLTNLPDLANGTAVRVRPVDLGPKLSRRAAARVVLEAPRTLVRLARALSGERPGTTFLHFKKEQLLCALLPRRVTGEIVWAEWGPVPPALRRGLPRRAYALATRRVRRILAVSEGTRQTVIATGVAPEKVVVVPNLVDVDAVGFVAEARERLRAEWGVDDDTLVAGCISRFQRRKRNDVVIDAMAHVPDGVVLVMAGEGEEEQALRERAAPYGDRVRFVANVRGHVEEFLSACDVLVFAPSPTEGAPRVIVMAQLVGRPVVATDPEGAAELIADGTGTVVAPSHDPAALAAVLAAYRDDPERVTREGAAARIACARRHDPERTLALVEDAMGLSRGAGVAP